METVLRSWLRFGFLLQQVVKHLRKPWDVKFDKLNSQLKSGSSFILFVLYLNASSLWLIQRHIVEDQSKILAQIKFVISLRKSLSILSNILQQTQISRVSREISLLFRQRSVTVLVEESFLPSVSPPCLTRPQIMTLSPRPPPPPRGCGHEKTFFTGRSIVGSVYKTLARFLVIIVDQAESHCRLCTSPGLCAYWD